MKVLTLFLLGILFTSCMHMGMPMMENGHQGHQAEPVLEKEISSGDVKAVATFPPMQAGREEVFTLKLTNKVSREPVTGAQVYFHVALLPHDESTTHSGTSPHNESTDDVDGARDATQSPDDPGVYTVTYGSPEVGNRNFAFHVTSVDGQRLDPELVVEAKRVIREGSRDDQEGMMMQSHRSTSTYMIVGGVLMAAMMSAMLIRGGM